MRKRETRTDTPEVRKARGAFFTPPTICAFLADWAIRSQRDLVFEPSCGEAAFLLAAGERLRRLGADPSAHLHLVGIDLHASSVDRARRLARDAGLNVSLSTGDFFDYESTNRFAAVLGNPPYVRYQGFAGSARTKARAAARAQGVSLTALASSWAAFVVHATSLLTDDGRLALVLPAELLSVNYAASVRSFLLEHFARVKLITFEERVFPEVMEEVVLLLAEGQGPTDHFELHAVQNLAELPMADAPPSIWRPASADEKWALALVANDAADAYLGIANDPGRFVPLLEWGDPTLGMVTGNNNWFTLTRDDVVKLGLEKSDLLPISPPGSRHLRGLAYDAGAWERMKNDGRRVYLFRPEDVPSEAAHRRIRSGERDNVHRAYKCRVRKTWWRTPLVRVPDLFFTYMNADAPRVVANLAGVHYLNSVHGITIAADRRDIGMRLLPLGMINSATLLGAELVGRSYGGGILKLEPKEADQLPVPSPELLRSAEQTLESMREKASGLLAEGRLDDVVSLVDDAVLVEHGGMSLDDVGRLRQARLRMHMRRITRNRT